MIFTYKQSFLIIVIFVGLIYNSLFVFGAILCSDNSGQYGCSSCSSNSCTGCTSEGSCTEDPCPIRSGWYCESTGSPTDYYYPEFGLVSGFLAFFSSLGIPYWLFRRRR